MTTPGSGVLEFDASRVPGADAQSIAFTGQPTKTLRVNPKFLASARDSIRAQLWPLPIVGIMLAVIAGVLLPHVDASMDAQMPPWLTALFFGGDAGAARTLLDAISSSLITVTSLTFSLTVVTLQLASSQFLPRLLRTFTSDIFVQSTLAVFLATFTYALTVLRAIRSGDGGEGGAFVPRISVTVAFVLGVVSVLGLVLFLAHLARQIRVETMLRDVHDGASATMRSATGSLQDARPQPDLPERPAHALAVTAPSSGFLTSIDEGDLLSAAIEADAYPRSTVIPAVRWSKGFPSALRGSVPAISTATPSSGSRVRSAARSESATSGPQPRTLGTDSAS